MGTGAGEHGHGNGTASVDAPLAVRAVTDGGNLLGEGPVWNAAAGVLTWVDIYGRRIHELDPATGARRHWIMPDRLSAAIPRHAGGMVVALSRTLAVFDPATGRLDEVARLPEDDRHRFNDAKCDGEGRLWVGSMNEEELRPTGALYCFDRAGLRLVETGIAISNSLAWSPAGDVLYFADTVERRIRAYGFDARQGALSHRREFAAVDGEAAFPDGSATDSEGHLWNAQWDGGRVVRYAPDGRVAGIVPLPVSRPTSACFGGAHMTTLFVTSAACDLSQAQLRREPEAGAVFAIEAGVRGAPVSFFAF